MSLDKLRALLRTYTPGRRVRLTDEAAASRRDKVPEGVAEGLILKVVPLPSTSELLVDWPIGLEIEFEPAPGAVDSMIVGTGEVVLEPLSIERIRADLLGRTVDFPRSRGIGIEFPPGASDKGVIEDARFRPADDERATDLVVSLRVAVDPAVHPEGHDRFRVEADFIQCVLLLRKLSG